MDMLQLILAAALSLGAANAEPTAPSNDTDARATIIELGSTSTATGDGSYEVQTYVETD